MQTQTYRRGIASASHIGTECLHDKSNAKLTVWKDSLQGVASDITGRPETNMDENKLSCTIKPRMVGHSLLLNRSDLLSFIR